MATKQGTQVTVQVPEGAPPGTLLSIPVRGGSEQVKIRVPEGVGAGSSLILVQADGSDEWDLRIGSVVPAPDDGDDAGFQPVSEEQEALDRQRRLEEEYFAQQRHHGLTNGGGASVAEAAASRQVEPPHSPYQPVEVPAPEASPDSVVAYTVRLETTVGPIDIIVRPDWAPNGTRRFLELAASGDLNELAFYRAIKGCIAQFGLPAKRQWPAIPDDPASGVPFLLGAISFAAVGKDARKSTLFICTGDMTHCLGQNSWETPIGAVAEHSLDVLDRIETMYGDIAEFNGQGPDTSRITSEGNAYLRAEFPGLSYIRVAQPLDWDDGRGYQPATGSTAPAPAPSPAPAPVPVQRAAPMELAPAPRSHSVTDAVAMAMQAAQEAQAQAEHAAQLAQQAARSEHIAQAQEAAQLAAEAARAATAAARAAQDARATQEAADVPGAMLGSVRNIGLQHVGSAVLSQARPAMVVGGDNLALVPAQSPASGFANRAMRVSDPLPSPLRMGSVVGVGESPLLRVEQAPLPSRPSWTIQGGIEEYSAPLIPAPSFSSQVEQISQSVAAASSKFRSGQNCEVMRSDGGWSPCRVTEVMADGSVLVQLLGSGGSAISNQQKRIPATAVGRMLRFAQAAVVAGQAVRSPAAVPTAATPMQVGGGGSVSYQPPPQVSVAQPAQLMPPAQQAALAPAPTHSVVQQMLAGGLQHAPPTPQPQPQMQFGAFPSVAQVGPMPSIPSMAVQTMPMAGGGMMSPPMMSMGTVVAAPQPCGQPMPGPPMSVQLAPAMAAPPGVVFR
eukprot:TRINITY_DN22572_c0_g1_i1.p1 TRINITY_DN22572_c0_g1~~TRINITY_DN22572_c0_g1_i1.p1  ORF type:complete len:785 (-),score=161.87 TRINITY_DN22572_c0_g1_i1:115-2469(-)